MNAPHADLPAEVLALLPELPNGPHLPAQRAWMLASDARFASAMRHVEADGVPPRSLAELWLWLVHLAVDMGSRPATTCQSYGRTVGRWLRWCARNGIDFAAATQADFDHWQRWLAMQCRNGATWRAQQVNALRNFYDWRRSRGLAKSNIAADLTGPRVKPKPPKKYTDDQLRALFRAIAETTARRRIRDKCAVLLLLTTGLRREELCGLTLGQIEINRRIGVVRVQGKGAKQRDVPFEGPVVEALQEWLAERDALPFPVDPDALFVSLHGRTLGEPLNLRSFEVMISVHAKAANLRDWGIHRFRVTYATQLYDDGADIETIRARMGHESIETTRRYLAVSERARRVRLSADRQHRVLGTKPTGVPLWARLAAGELVP